MISEIYMRQLSLSLTLVLMGSPVYAEPHASKYLGVATCASSNCHGSTSPRTSANILQNEYVTWSKHDKHSSAWKALTSNESKTIGKHLGITKPESEPWCISCHATAAPKDLQSPEFRIEDGVGCESCHGAAEGYIKAHTESAATHSRNLELGLMDLVPLSKRAKLCLDCHYGSENASVTHRLIGAGHPRLSFELDTFSMLQPRHWKVDNDYRDRKAEYNSTRAWLIGQVQLARSTIGALTSDKRSKAGPFPELSLLACYSCHHSLSQSQWKARQYEGRPGELKLNTAPFFIIENALRALGSKHADTIHEEVSKLHLAFHREGKVSSVNGMESSLDSSEKFFSTVTLDDHMLKTLLRTTATTCSSAPQLQYESAEQIAMALSSILAELSTVANIYESEIKEIYTSLKSANEFVAEDFTTACTKLRKKLV